MPDDTFPETERSRLRRLSQRGSHAREDVYRILDAGLLCHVGYTIDGEPYVTPTFCWREGDRVYWHGSAASRMLRTVTQGLPVCLTLSLLDGLVLARSGFHHSVNYRSVMLFGRAHAVTDEARKLAALEAYMERLLPGRWPELRPVTAKELKATTVAGMDIDEASAKVRVGPPVDDEEDYALDCWAGVVPVHTVLGTPEPDPRLKPGIAPPAYLKDVKLD